MKIPYNRTRLYLAAFVANCLYLSTGLALTWTSPSLDHIKATESQKAWITSMVAFGAILGPVMYNVGIGFIGRKGTLILNGVIFITSWCIIGPSKDFVYLLYLGRFISGIAVGCTFNIIPLYITEISDDEIRQTLSSLCEFFIAIGYMITYCAGPFVSYEWLVGISSLPAVLFVITIVFMPESPYYLLEKARSNDALDALSWLRYGEGSLQERFTIEESVIESRKNNGRMVDLFINRGPRKALLISMFMLGVQQLSAVDAITANTQSMFPKMSLTEYQQAIIIGTVNLFAAALGPPIVNRVGLKTTLVTCAIFCGLSLIAYGTYEHFVEYNYNVESARYTPLISLMAFNIFFCIGLGGLPWAIAAELFPNSLKGNAISLTSSLCWFLAWFIMWFYGEYRTKMGQSPMFLFWGTSVTLGGLLMTVMVPETKGKSLQEILLSLEK